jgi:protein TonB
MISLILVIGVHVLLIYGLNAGFGQVTKDKALGNIQTVEVLAAEEEEDRPPPPPPKVDTAPPPFVPPPDIFIESAPVESTTAIQVTTAQRPIEAPPPVARTVTHSPPEYDKKRMKSYTLPEYPPSELRAGHEGTVYLDLMVQVDGRIGEVRVKTSTGFPRLDEAAISHVKRTYRLTPAMEDGKPVPGWVTLPVVFRIDNK